MAEAHPVGFRWVMKAKERGATIIHVDPRFSRTSALADIWVPIRAGGDIAFLGGLVQAHHRERICSFAITSCTSPMRPAFCAKSSAIPEEGATGLFSGWNEEERTYDKESWFYHGERSELSAARSHPARSPMRFPNIESSFCPLHAGDGGENLRHSAGALPQGRGRARRSIGSGQDGRDLLCASAGRSIRRAFRSFAPRRSCNYCLAISAGPVAASSPCAVMLRSRARPIFRRSTTFCRVTSRCRARRQRRDACSDYLAQPDKTNRSLANIPEPTSSAC